MKSILTTLFTIALLIMNGWAHGTTIPMYSPKDGPDGISQQNYPFADYKAQLFPAKIDVHWRIPQTTLPRHTVPVAGANVKDFGAKGDGKTDDTRAFHLALNTMAAAGGGSVWVPAGKYVIRGTLAIPINVCLEGEWEQPKPGQPLRGTILMAYAGRGDAEGTPFITLHANCGVRNLSVWYPEQKADAEPVPYPWTFFERPKSNFKPCATVENVTLVNSYRGIFFGASLKGSVNWYLRHIYGTPLEIGIQTDMTNDTGRLYNVDFAPNYWIDSALPGAPSSPEAKALKWLRANGIAFLIRRQDFAHWGPFSARGYAIGLKGRGSLEVNEAEEWIKAYGNAQFQGHFWGVDFQDCGTAMDLAEIQEAGVVLTDCRLEGRDVGLTVQPGTRFYIQLQRCQVKGKQAAVQSAEPMHLGFLECQIDGPLNVSAGSLSLVSCQVKNSPEAPRAEAVTVQGGQWPQAWAATAAKNRLFDATPVSPSPKAKKQPDANFLPAMRFRADAKLHVVPSKELHEDITELLRQTLGQAKAGDIVLIPPGYYRLSGPIVIPAGVELRGCLDLPQHVVRAPVVLLLDGKLAGTQEPIVSMEEGATVAGLSFFPPEQDWQQPEEYPFLFLAKGKRTALRNLSAAAIPYFAKYEGGKAGDFEVDSINANVLKEGFRVGGGVADGRIMNVHFISHLWTLMNSAWQPEWLEKVWGSKKEELPLDMWQDEEKGKAFIRRLEDHFDAYLLGDASGLFLYHNFTYGCHAGVRTLTENGKGPNAWILHGAGDASLYGAQIEGASPDGLVLTNYMVYATNPKRSVALRIKMPQDQSVIFDSLQTAGPSKTTMEFNGGNAFFPGAVFADLSKNYFQFEAGSLDSEGPLFFRPNVTLNLGANARLDLVGAVEAAPIQLNLTRKDAATIRGAVIYQPHPALQRKKP